MKNTTNMKKKTKIVESLEIKNLKRDVQKKKK